MPYKQHYAGPTVSCRLHRVWGPERSAVLETPSRLTATLSEDPAGLKLPQEGADAKADQ